MLTGTGSQETTFGYLAIVESPEYGYFGGYLIISPLGRPLEFHCTAPVRPSRAQQILYGPTLEPYLIGEQICGALLGTAKLTPAVILTDCEATLDARARFGTPIVLIARTELSAATSVVSNDHPGNPLDRYTFQYASGFRTDESIAIGALRQLVTQVELVEPFARIREAIDEAQRIGGRGASANEQAA
jgi:hypothetical protein